MPSKKRTRRQARIERKSLIKLKSTGLFKGRIDARRKANPAQKRALKRFADVIAGRAKVLTPKKPKSYARQFRVIGKRVIVPVRKGRRPRVVGGEIHFTVKRGKRSRRGVLRKLSELAQTPKVYMLPLRRGDGIDWHQFPSREKLEEFIYVTSPKIGQTFKHIADHVLEIDADKADDFDDEDDDKLERALHRQLGRAIRARKRARAARRRRK